MSGCRMFQYVTYRMLRSQLSGRLLGYQQLSEIHMNVQVWNVQVWNFEVWSLATFRLSPSGHSGPRAKHDSRKQSLAIIGGILEPAQKWHHVLATIPAVDFQFRGTP
jgi:hypothetical protein